MWLQICIKWGLQHGTSVIPKGTSEEHVVGNLDVLDWELSSEDYEVRLQAVPYPCVYTSTSMCVCVYVSVIHVCVCQRCPCVCVCVRQCVCTSEISVCEYISVIHVCARQHVIRIGHRFHFT